MNRVQIKFIETCEENESLLTDWERGFVDDLCNKDDDYILTFNQNKKLNQIVKRVEFL